MRILLAGMSNMLSNIVAAALAQAPDIVVAGRVANEAELAASIRRESADAVIVQTGEPAAPARFTALLQGFPDLKVVAIDPSGKRGALHQLRPYSLHFTDVSVDTLLSALRASSTPIRRAARRRDPQSRLG